MLDGEEYLRLALHASSVGQHHACLMYLKEALQLDPQNARAIYLLAVQHAELGLADRAIAGLQRTVSLDPALEAARFQLGLMLLDRGRPGEAKQQLGIVGRSADRSLRACAEALIALADNDSDGARSKLTAELALKPADGVLVPLMKRLLEKISEVDDSALGAHRKAMI
jgi:tetratricopeptide (TPR) repeat protein